ncbi:helix-turn-helix transcriptional regulator [Kineococcus sp. TRM81007]|uniref:helix-turn-helix transcriptional regulator n=1 Tax=Kineococcus sp. TRM81007 TaxID=2925831 RepID=UPI001F589BCB|nr:helix-turn-helix transcriptional regulator [Kineococcus sp. TRM81007]MCI2239445.1 helix-turn-helix transcriptional regulator [Kineococcus sp. TRM81007]
MNGSGEVLVLRSAPEVPRAGTVPRSRAGAGTRVPPGAAAPPTLGDFLRAMRSRLRPQDVGLPASSGHRRVPGLRRQEVADLAGVSLDYYTRIEQGRVGEVSGAVLNSVGEALLLSAEETALLHRLAAPSRSVPRPRPEGRLRPGTTGMLASLTVPAAVVNHRTDVLAANLPFRLLVARPSGPPEAMGNLVRWHFLDPWARELLPEWRDSAGAAVAGLRLNWVRNPGDPELDGLVAELSARSTEFSRVWGVPGVTGASHGRLTVEHPWAGTCRLDQQVLPLPGEGVFLTLQTPVPGTGSEAVLDRLLRCWRGPRPDLFWDVRRPGAGRAPDGG